MTAVIIDDEKGGRTYLNDLLDRHCPDITVLGTANNVESGLECLEKHKPDILFLDIQMPGGSGFRLLDFLETVPFQVIFTTAYENYATKAFRYAAVDYLLKPVNKTHLQEAIERAQIRSLVSEKVDQHLKVAKENLQQGQFLKIVLPKSRGSEVFELDEIMYVESAGNYALVYSSTNGRTLINLNLRQVEQRIVEERFFKIQQSYIVNMQWIKKVNLSTEPSVTLSNGRTIRIARRKKKSFGEAFDQYSKSKR